MKLKKLNRQQDLSIIQGVLLTSIAFILYLSEGVLRPSISDYYYGNTALFGMLIGFGAITYFYNGYLYVQERWADIIVAIGLVIVGLTGHNDQPYIHYIGAGIFFIGEGINIIYFSSKKQRLFKIILVSLAWLALIIHFVSGCYTLFWAEEIAIALYSLNYIGQGTGILD